MRTKGKAVSQGEAAFFIFPSVECCNVFLRVASLAAIYGKWLAGESNGLTISREAAFCEFVKATMLILSESLCFFLSENPSSY